MHIVCPHCATSYAVNLATLGAAGRPCAAPAARRSGWRGRRMPTESWPWPVPAMAAAGARPAADRRRRGVGSDGAPRTTAPTPPSSTAPRSRADWPADARLRTTTPTGRRSPSTTCRAPDARPQHRSWFRKLFRPTRRCRPRAAQVVRQPADRLRRDGRAGAGADDLARRSGAAAAADRRPSTRWSASR